MEMIKRLIKEEEGQGMVEYVLIIAGIALLIVAAMKVLGPKINQKVEDALK